METKEELDNVAHISPSSFKTFLKYIHHLKIYEFIYAN